MLRRTPVKHLGSRLKPSIGSHTKVCDIFQNLSIYRNSQETRQEGKLAVNSF
jgi:hypothetical protein